MNHDRKKYAVLLIAAALVLGGAPHAVASGETPAPSSSTGTGAARAAKVAAAKAERTTTLDAARTAYRQADALAANTAAAKLAELETRYNQDLQSVGVGLSARAAAAAEKTVRRTYQAAVAKVKKDHATQRKTNAKAYADAKKSIDATYRAAIRAAR